jgi:hypothetical protein
MPHCKCCYPNGKKWESATISCGDAINTVGSAVSIITNKICGKSVPKSPPLVELELPIKKSVCA